MTTINNFCRCATYELENHKEQLTKVEIKSPVDVYVIFHSKEQISIPKELSARKTFEGYHNIEVTIQKTINLNQKEKHCYNPADNGGISFGMHEYQLLMKRIMKNFNCTTPFIPDKYRKDSDICLNQTTLEKVHEFLKFSSSSFVSNMWKSNYYGIPPCVYTTYAIDEAIKGKGDSLFKIQCLTNLLL